MCVILLGLQNNAKWWSTKLCYRNSFAIESEIKLCYLVKCIISSDANLCHLLRCQIVISHSDRICHLVLCQFISFGVMLTVIILCNARLYQLMSFYAMSFSIMLNCVIFAMFGSSIWHSVKLYHLVQC